MPYSFTKIEQDKTRTIGFVFVFLILLYFIAAWAIFFATKAYGIIENRDYLYNPVPFSMSLPETLIALGIALVVGVGHWSLTTNNLVPKISKALRAEPLNPKDTYHQMFQNIIDEVSVATGGRKIEGVVIPTMAMNAFALADFEGRAVIGVTEGLLARLSRAQLEAVVGHEAAHIVSGDCLATTVTSSLVRLYSSVLSKMSWMTDDRGSYRSRSGGYIVIIYLLIWIVNAVSLLLNMFISRQKELRADAVAVRLTRDPLSLAEALYSISNRWRGSGIPGEELEAIFIVNPRLNRMDESASFLADLFSTHPPVEKRLDVLLNMAHSDAAELAKAFEQRMSRPRQIIADAMPAELSSGSTAAEWLVHKDNQWLGPFTFEQLSGLGWVAPETWVKQLGAEHIERAYEDSRVGQLFSKSESETSVDSTCPRCRVHLNEISYEGTPILKCPQCGGVLVNGNDILRIFIRQDYGFSDRIKSMAAVVKKEQVKRAGQKLDLRTVNLYSCPRCRSSEKKMIRGFYSLEYFVEVDRCYYCGSVWFDKDEMEILQCLVEENTS